MVAIFTGAGTGFERGSGNVVGAAGLLGSSALGRGGEQLFLNAATGNLMINRQDEFLAGRGPDIGINRTYNSLGNFTDDNGDNWRQSMDRRVFGLTGTANTSGSTVKRRSGDGSEITYSWNGSTYVATDGAGAHDKLAYNSGTSKWTWTDGDSQITEVYGAFGLEWRIEGQADTSGNSLAFSYTGANLTRVTSANGEYTEFGWSGSNITQIVTGYTEGGVAKTLTRTRYGYDGSNRLTNVTVDETPNDNSIADNNKYVTTYTYDGASKRVATISQTDGSHLAIVYDSSGRVTSLTQTAAAGDVRVTRIGYGVNVTSVTGPDDQVTRLWYDNKGQLIQLMAPPATPGGISQVRQFEYDANGNLLRTIETDSANASIPNNLIQVSGWGDGEIGHRGENLIDDSGWPQDVDGTLPAPGTVGQGWTSNYIGETEWTVTTGPYGQQAVSLHAGQADTSDAGGGAYSQSFAIDKSKAYEFTLYFKADALNMHRVYLGLGSTVVKNGNNGVYNASPYFTYDFPTSEAGMQAGKWYKIVGYVLPGSTPIEAHGSYGGIYDLETGERLKEVHHFIWDESQSGTTTVTRFFNFYDTQNQGKFTHFLKPEVREVSDFAMLRDGDKLDVARDRDLLLRPAPDGWPYLPIVNGGNETRWNEVMGPDGAWQVGLETGQFDTAAYGGGGYTNNFTVDPAKAYRFTQYVRKSDLTRHTIHFGLTNSSQPYVKYAHNGTDATNPYFVAWGSSTQQTYLEEDRWYKIVGYVLPEGSANIAYSSLGGIYDAVTGARVADVTNFRWHENMPGNQVYTRFFNYSDELQHGWSTDWLAPEVVEIAVGDLAADSADPFGIVYDESGQITSYAYDASGNVLTATDRLGNVVTRTYSATNRVLTETRVGSNGNSAAASHTTRFVYDAKDRLQFVVSAEGNVTSYWYNALGQMYWSEAYADYFYDVSALAPSTAITLAQMNAWYAANPDETTTIKIEVNYFDARGNKTQSNSYGATDAAGQPATGLGYNVVTFVYDQAGQLLSRTTSGRSSETFVYDGLGRVTASVDLNGATTTILFNDAATTTTVTIAGSLVQTSTYNKAGELLSHAESGTGVSGGTASYTYDALGRVRKVTDATGKVSYVLYDKMGRKVADIGSLGEVTEYRYDSRNRLVATVSYKNLLNATQLANAANPRSTAEMPAMRPTADAADLWTWTVYDAEGRVVEAIDGDGSVTAYEYDASSRLVKTTSYAGKLNATQIAGFKTTPPENVVLPATHADDSVARVFYDKDGRVIGALDGNGYLTRTVYDKAGRVVQEIAYATATNAANRATGSFQTLLTGAGTSANDRSIRYVYDAQGLLRFTINGLNQVVEHVYESAAGSSDAHGPVRRTIGYAGSIGTPSSYTVAGVRAALTAAGLTSHADNRSSWAIYDTAGQVAYAIDATGAVTSYEYNTLGLVTKAVAYATQRPTTSLPTQAMMDSWKASNIANAANRVTRNYYNAKGELRFVIDGEGFVSETGYDAEGRILSTTRWSAVVSATDAWTLANVVAAAKGTGAVTATEYDHLGRVWKTTDAAGTVTRNTYSAAGLLIQVELAFGTADVSVSTYEYDAAGRIAKQVDGVGDANAQTEFTYDGFGNVLTVKRRNSHPDTPTAYTYATTSFTYDKLGRVLTQTNALSGVVTQEYNAFGDNVRTIDERSNSTWRYFDKLGRVVSVRDAENYVSETSYTEFGEVESVTRRYNKATNTASVSALPVYVADPLKDATTSFEYDRLGRVTKSIDALGNYEQYTLNAFGDRATVRNKLGGITTNSFDRRGLLTQESIAVSAVYGSSLGTQAATIVNKFEYDARGNLTKTIEALGATEQRTTTFAYDSLNRLSSKTGMQVATGLAGTLVTPSETYLYDRRGNLIETKVESIDSANTRTVLSRTLSYYDDLDRKIVEIDPLGAVRTHAYDAAGNLVLTRAYDTLVALPAIAGGTATLPGGTWRETTYTYDNLDRLLTRSVANQLTGSWNGAAYVTTTGALATSYEYDAAGNVIKTTDPNGNAIFSYYDKLGRKTAQVDQERYQTSWLLDAEGNVLLERRFVTQAGSVTTSTPPFAIDATAVAGDRLTHFAYDKLGRRTSETRTGVAAWTINASTGTLTAATGDSRIEYTYNALGQVATRKEANGDTTSYTYDDAGRLIVEERAAYADFMGNSLSPTLRYFYDKLDQLTSTRQGMFAIDASDRIATNSYTAGRLTAAVDAAGFQRNYRYDAMGRVVAESYARVLSSGSAVSEAIVYAYDAAGQLVTQSHARHNGSAWVHADAAGQAYDATRLRYNAHRELTGRGITAGPAAAAVYQEFYDYDSAGRMWRSNAGDGVLKFHLYDKTGNQTLTLSSAGADLSALTISNYTASVTGTGGTSTADAVTTVTVHDKRGLVKETREPDRQLAAGGAGVTLLAERSYNAFGEVVSQSNSRRSTDPAVFTTFAYNTMGRLVRTERPTVSITLENGAQLWVKPSEDHYYDLSGRLIGTRDANGDYGSGGTSASGASKAADTGKLTTRLLLAGTGHGGGEALVAKAFHPDGGVFQTLYDVFGDARILRNELYTGSNAAQTDELHSYDAMGRVTAITRRGGQLIDRYEYDGLGQTLRHSIEEVGTATIANISAYVEKTDYDAQGRIVSTVAMGGDTTTTSYAWDAGLVTSGLGTFGGWTQTTTYANGRTSIEKSDMFGHLAWKRDLGAHVTTYAYDKAGRQTSSAGAATSTFIWLNTGQLAGTTGPAGAASYTYDAAGNRLSEKLVNGAVTLKNQTATYDALGRLKTWAEAGSSVSPAASSAYEYDANGNIRRTQISQSILNATGGVGSVQTKDHWFRFDSMNRLVTDKGQLSGTAGATGTTIVRGTTGADFLYDKAGNRMQMLRTIEHVVSISNPDYRDPNWDNPYIPAYYTETLREDYGYDAQGRLASVRIAASSYSDNYDGTITVTPPPATGTLTASYGYDALGRQLQQRDYAGDGTTIVFSRTLTYNAKGQTLTDDSSSLRLDGQLYRSVSAYSYTDQTTGEYLLGATGRITTTNYRNGIDDGPAPNGAPDTQTTYSHHWYDGAVQASSTFDSDTDYVSNPVYTSSYTYNGFGQLTSVYIGGDKSRTVTFTNDELGRAIRRDEGSIAGQTGAPHEVWYHFGGRQMGYSGNNGTDDLDYSASVYERQARAPTNPGTFRGGSTGSYAHADFVNSAEMVNSYNQGSAAGRYTARTGDTLQSIAAQLWGDASLWYKIAEANGMSAGTALVEGQSLTLPSGVMRSSFNASTFKPFDPAEAIGDLSPTLPKPPKKNNKCGVVGAVIMAVVAVAVTIASAGAGVAVAKGLTLKGGIAAFLGLKGAATVGAGLAIGAGAAGGAVGSIASQGVGIAMGMQDRINWGGVALGGISGAIGGALGPNGIAGADGLFGGGVVQGAMRGVVSNALTQGIGVATGLQSKFDFAGVAAAGVGALAGGALGRRLGDPGSAGAAIGQRMLSGTAGGLANAAARSLINGTSFGDNLIAALPDIIAQTVGGAFETAVSGKWSGTQTAALGAMPFGQDVQSDVPEIVITHEPWSAWDEFSYRWSQLGDTLRFQIPVIGDPANHRTMEQYRQAELNARLPQTSLPQAVKQNSFVRAAKGLAYMTGAGSPSWSSDAAYVVGGTANALNQASASGMQLTAKVSQQVRSGDLIGAKNTITNAVIVQPALGVVKSVVTLPVRLTENFMTFFAGGVMGGSYQYGVDGAIATGGNLLEVAGLRTGASAAFSRPSGVAAAERIPQVTLNKAAGDAFEADVIANVLPKTQINIQPQITIKSSGPSGLKVRLDALGEDMTSGATRLSDMKASSTAPFTPNQTVVYPELELYGGVVVGKGKAPYVGGTNIPPTAVDVIRKVKR